MSYYNQNQPPVGVPLPQGYPPEGYPKDAYPTPGYRAQGYPPQGYPPQQGYAPPYAPVRAASPASTATRQQWLRGRPFGCFVLLLPLGCVLLMRNIAAKMG
ncbi:hypothetical protein I3760_01G081200 [Carya illinoinensis]|uniref:Rhodopsin n=1 Tax=Carya illinoinensis TaxID=32201 RepID=A0A8T1RK79_CARIL|nr:hypothetical protein I3760_01G081200 [Carya illinoinensis]KAG6667236.1 hypothetical protein CIPAW_01G087300 [Carya illinoinensis]